MSEHQHQVAAITFTIPGQPVGKGRPRVSTRGGKFARLYTPEKTANYEGLVAHAAQQAMQGRPLLTGAVYVELDICVQIPASWSGKRQAQAAQGGVAATKKPDADNVIKAVLDGLNGVMWADDVQVVRLLAHKRYAEVPGVRVVVRELALQAA